MKPMSRKVVFGACVSLALTLALTFDASYRAFSATQLDGFAINTHDKSVTVTLYTDQHASYTTESIGRQFTIVLSDVQLSKRQTEEGLPVVIDDKNRFIGRAVPTADGKVKIILPNLPANEYSVSIQQQSFHAAPDREAADPRFVASTSKAMSQPHIKPRSAVKLNTGTQFEKMTALNPEPVNSTKFSVTRVSSSRVPAEPVESDGFGDKSHHTIWNPYVVKRSGETPLVSHPMRLATASSPVDFTTAPSEQAVSDWNALAAAQARVEQLNRDPLAYLHAVPPMAFNAIPPQFPVLTNNVPHPASIVPALASKSPVGSAPDTKAKPLVTGSALKQQAVSSQLQPSPVQSGLSSTLPRWLWLTLALFLALFLGGIGLFCLIGALSLLRLVFIRELPASTKAVAAVSSSNALPFPNFLSQVQPLSAPLPGLFQTASVFLPEKPVIPYAFEQPGRIASRKMRFADTAVVNALDYTTRSPRTMSDAVESSLALRFSSRHAKQSLRK